MKEAAQGQDPLAVSYSSYTKQYWKGRRVHNVLQFDTQLHSDAKANFTSGLDIPHLLKQTIDRGA